MPQYQGVWSLQSAAQLQSTQRWVTDPLYKDTTLLLQADNAGNASQNNTFLDSSSNTFTITRNGNTTQGSFTPFSQPPGTWSNFFDGSGDYLSWSGSGVGADTFVAECWFYLTNTAFSTQYGLFGASTTFGFSLRLINTSTAAVDRLGISAQNFALPENLVVNKWYHIAAVRNSSNQTTIFLNGVRSPSGAVSVTLNFGGTTSAIGLADTVSNTDFLFGYVSNARLVIGGTPIYDPTQSRITVPTVPLTAIPNTAILTCQDNRFKDNSNNAFPITRNGDVSVQAFSPFPPQYQWTSSVIGGSGYFDGTGDYLSIAASSQFLPGVNTDFTFEAWVYLTATPGATNGRIVGTGEYGTDADWVLEVNSSRQIFFYINVPPTGLSITSSTAINLFSWNHVAITRQGTGSNNLKLFLNGVNVGQTSTNITLDYTGNNLTLGADANGDESNLTGYISGLRLINGTGYTSISVPTAPPTAITNTVLLTNFTNAAIFDGTMKNNLETVGNAQISTAVVKYGSGSMYFDGTSDYLRNVAVPVSFLRWWLGEYTVEYWLYANAFTQGGNTDSVVIGLMNPTTTNNYWSFGPISNGTIKLHYFNGSAQAITTTQAIATGQWYHLAMVQRQGIVYIYINGVLATSAAYSGTPQAVVDANHYLVLGSTNNASFNGYLDDVRITLAARYTTNFIPPSVALPRQ